MEMVDDATSYVVSLSVPFERRMEVLADCRAANKCAVLAPRSPGVRTRTNSLPRLTRDVNSINKSTVDDEVEFCIQATDLKAQPFFASFTRVPSGHMVHSACPALEKEFVESHATHKLFTT